MILRRKVEKELLRWKESGSRKCLVVAGARQVGKTFIIEDFARRNYENHITINFIEDPDAKKIFEGQLDVGSIIMRMSSRYTKVRFEPDHTLIFLDEIQECPNARAALKFFTLDGHYDVVASGSLMGLRTRNVVSIPVGYETRLRMGPLDFHEFLWAMGVPENVIEYVQDRIRDKEPIDETILDAMYGYMRQYMVVGGFPEVVKSFASDRRMDTVRGILADILAAYEDDIGKYAKEGEKDKVKKCFDSIAAQLAKDNKTFRFSAIESKDYSVGSSRYQYALNWLDQAALSLPCYRVTEPHMPLVEKMDENKFKLYLLDTGLLLTLYETGMPYEILTGNIGVNRGALTENMVACMLHAQGRRLMYYQRSEPGQSRMELDFITSVNGTIAALEVKSGENRECRSLNKAMATFGIQGIMLETRNIFTDEKGVTHYPLFAAAFMDCIDPPREMEMFAPDNEELGKLAEDLLRKKRAPGTHVDDDDL